MADKALMLNLVGRCRRVWPAQGRDYFHINLSSGHRAHVAPLRLVLIGLCLVLFWGMVWDVEHAVIGYRESLKIGKELDRVRQQDAQLMADARQAGLDVSEQGLQQLPTEVALANQLLEKRVFSWTKFLAGLEHAIPPRLSLSSVRLDAGATVHLTGTAMSLEDVTALTVGLQDHPRFKDPVLAQHRVNSNGLVEFTITLHYRGEGV